MCNTCTVVIESKKGNSSVSNSIEDVKFYNITQDNLIWFAVNHYDNPTCSSLKELKNDLNTPKYIAKLFYNQKYNGQIKDRLILNHLILFYNVFDPVAANKILFFRMSEDYYEILKSFLIFIGYCPKIVYSVDGYDINFKNVKEDSETLERLNRDI